MAVQLAKLGFIWRSLADGKSFVLTTDSCWNGHLTETRVWI